MTAALQDHSLAIARHFLPGLRQPVGVGAHLQALAQQNVAIQQQVAAQAGQAPMLERKKLHLCAQVCRLCGVANEANINVPFWALFPSLKSGNVLGTLEGYTLHTAEDLNLQTPLLSPALATNIGNGCFTSPNINDVTEGLSILHLCTQSSPQCATINMCNRVYVAMAQGAGLRWFSAASRAGDMSVVVSGLRATSLVFRLQSLGVQTPCI